MFNYSFLFDSIWVEEFRQTEMGQIFTKSTFPAVRVEAV